jgi:hypothetical protein
MDAGGRTEWTLAVEPGWTRAAPGIGVGRADLAGPDAIGADDGT